MQLLSRAARSRAGHGLCAARADAAMFFGCWSAKCFWWREVCGAEQRQSADGGSVPVVIQMGFIGWCKPKLDVAEQLRREVRAVIHASRASSGALDAGWVPLAITDRWAFDSDGVGRTFRVVRTFTFVTKTLALLPCATIGFPLFPGCSPRRVLPPSDAPRLRGQCLRPRWARSAGSRSALRPVLSWERWEGQATASFLGGFPLFSTAFCLCLRSPCAPRDAAKDVLFSVPG